MVDWGLVFQLNMRGDKLRKRFNESVENCIASF